MPINKVLSICIPTYNRASLLRGCMDNLIPQVKKHKIAIYVSDNASKDGTANVILQAKKEYPYIYYRRNIRNFGPDFNEAKALKMSRSRYAWLLGDKYRIVKGSIDIVMSRLHDLGPDLMIVNTGDKADNLEKLVNQSVKDVKRNRVYRERNVLLKELGWHSTLISSLIFGSKIIRKGNFRKYIGTNFIHFGVIFDYLSRREFKVYWYSSPIVYSAGWVKWLSAAFEIFAKKFFILVMSLPSSYTKEAKLKCLKDHGVKSTLFTFKVLIKFRGLGYYDLAKYMKYHEYLPYVSNVPLFIFYLISIAPIPAWLIQFLRRIKASMDNRTYLDAKR